MDKLYQYVLKLIDEFDKPDEEDVKPIELESDKEMDFDDLAELIYNNEQADKKKSKIVFSQSLKLNVTSSINEIQDLYKSDDIIFNLYNEIESLKCETMQLRKETEKYPKPLENPDIDEFDQFSEFDDDVHSLNYNSINKTETKIYRQESKSNMILKLNQKMKDKSKKDLMSDDMKEIFEANPDLKKHYQETCEIDDLLNEISHKKDETQNIISQFEMDNKKSIQKTFSMLTNRIDYNDNQNISEVIKEVLLRTETEVQVIAEGSEEESIAVIDVSVGELQFMDGSIISLENNLVEQNLSLNEVQITIIDAGTGNTNVNFKKLLVKSVENFNIALFVANWISDHVKDYSKSFLKLAEEKFNKMVEFMEELKKNIDKITVLKDNNHKFKLKIKEQKEIITKYEQTVESLQKELKLFKK